MNKLHIHKYVFQGYHHLECMPNDTKGVSLYFTCSVCGKEKNKAYLYMGGDKK